MSREEMRSFLGEGTRTGKLATVMPDGRPHVVPVWFVIDGDDLVFSTWHTTVKAKNLARTGRAALCVDLQQPPYAFVLARGPVTISDDLERLRHYAELIGGRYMGGERAAEFGARNAVEGELLVRLHIDKLTSADEMTG